MSNVQTLNFFPNNVDKLNLQGINPVLTISVLVQNTSNDDLTVSSISGNIIANGDIVGNVAMFNPFVVKANSQNVLSIDATMQPIGVLQNIINALQNGNFQQKITFSGFANVESYQLPINLDYTIGASQSVKA